MNFYGKKICKILKPIEFELIKHFLLSKDDDYDNGIPRSHISYSDDDKTTYFIKGNYHPSEKIKQLIKDNNNGIYDNTALRKIYNNFQIFTNTPYEIKYLCCDGRGMRYQKRVY